MFTTPEMLCQLSACVSGLGEMRPQVERKGQVLTEERLSQCRLLFTHEPIPTLPLCPKLHGKQLLAVFSGMQKQ